MVFAILMLVAFLLLIALSFPIAVALGIVSLFAFNFQMSTSFLAFIHRMWTSVDSYPILAVPLYMFAGMLMGYSGISGRIIRFSDALMGHIQGGLAMVNILASMIFAGMSGSSVADTASIGRIIIPEMVKQKYEPSFSAAVTAVSSTIGSIIPPSIPMIIVGVLLNVSIGKLFLGGLIPGIMIGFGMMVISFFIAKRRDYPVSHENINLKGLWKEFKNSFMAFLAPVIIIGGIMSGVFTATEAGGAVVVYIMVVGLFVYKELTLRSIYECLWVTGLSVAKVFFIISMASIFTWLLTINAFPYLISDLLLATSKSPTMIMGMLVVLILLVTTVITGIATLIMFLPLFFPIAISVGADPIHFGVLATIAMAIGLVTPPVGTCLYVTSDISGVNIFKIGKEELPYILLEVAVLFILLLFPELVTFLPRVLLG